MPTTDEKILATLEKLNNKLDSSDAFSSGGTDRRSSRSASSSDDYTRNRKAAASASFLDGKVSSLADSIEDAISRYGGTFDYFTGKYENFVSYTVKSQARLISEMANEADRLIGDRTIVGVFGSAHQARKELQEIYNVNSYYINRIAEDYNGATEKGTEMMLEALTIQRAMRIKNADFQKIIANEMAGTETVTQDVFKKIAFYAEAYSQQTAASIYQITNNITAAMADYEKYGAASEEAIGKFGATLSQLKLDTSSIDSLVAKMQTFEGAAGLARDLGGAFSAVIDPIELMNKAFTDPAEAVAMIRDALIDSGADAESLGHAVTFVAKNLNMSVNDARKLLDANVDISEIISNSVSATGYSAESADAVITRLQKSIIETQSAADIVLERGQSMYEVAIDSSFMMFKELQNNLKAFLANDDTLLKLFEGSEEKIQEYSQLLSKIATTQGQERIDAVNEFNEKMNAIIDNEDASEAVKKRAQEMVDQMATIQEAGFNKVLDKIQDPPPMTVRLEADTEAIENDLNVFSKSDVFDAVSTSWENSFAFTKRRSPSPLEIQTKAAVEAFASEKDVKWKNNLNQSLAKALTAPVTAVFDPAEEKLIKGGKIDADLVIKTENEMLISAFSANTKIQEQILAELKGRKDTKLENNITLSSDLKLDNVVLGQIIAQAVDERLLQKGVVT